MSIPRFIVSRGELLAAATVDALGDHQPGDVEVVKYADHVAAMEEGLTADVFNLWVARKERQARQQGREQAIRDCIVAVGNATYGFRGVYHYIVDETVETALAALRALLTERSE